MNNFPATLGLVATVLVFLSSLSILSASNNTSPGNVTPSSPTPSLLALPCQHDHCLEVNSSSPGSGPGTFSAALQTAMLYNHSVEIRLSEGTFALPQNDLVTFHGWNDLLLIGASPEETTITCNDDEEVGLVFRNSSHISIAFLSVIGCGRVFTTSSFNNSTPELTFIQSKTALYFTFCSDVSLMNVTVKNSQGSGVTMYNTRGRNYFKASQFLSNYMNEGDPYIGGGGVAIETSYCAPGDLNCSAAERSVLETNDSSYTFESCEFSSNRATSHYAYYDSVYPHATRHLGLGTGGGISVVLKGRAYRNNVTIESCRFKTNRAEWGGALLLAFADTPVNNSIEVTNSIFYLNNYRDGRDLDRTNKTVGGAVRISMVSYPDLYNYTSDVRGNEVIFKDTLFSSNFASLGGAVSFVTTRNLPDQKGKDVNSLLFENCNFTDNQASISASAVAMTSWKPDIVDSKEPFLQPIFDGCRFYHNSLLMLNISDYKVSRGAVYISTIPVKFSGYNEFCKNKNTAMAVFGTFVSVLDSAVMNFTRNEGINGGALSFVGDSWLVTHDNTTLHFEENTVGAYGLGGAVYAARYGENSFPYDQNCFFRFHKYGMPPQNWNATFVFKNNYANKLLNSIYTSSITPCVWSEESKAFCENTTWLFEGGPERNCTSEINTGPNSVSFEKRIISIVPGWNFTMGAKMFDDYGVSISPVFTASPSPSNENILSVADSSRYISDDTVVLYGQENKSTDLVLMTLEPQVVAGVVRIEILRCPPGFKSKPCDEEKNQGMTCDCICLNVSGISCDKNQRKAYVYRDTCMTYDNTTGSLFVGECAYRQKQLINLKHINYSQLNEAMCGKLNRQGLLCSLCKEGYGVAVNRYNHICVSCRDHERYDWALFLLLELGPLTAVCAVIILFRISLASPYVNSFVFFSQIVSVVYYHNPYSFYFGVEIVNIKLTYPILSFYGLFNLDFFASFLPGICLHQGLNSLHILVINYVKALYPMFIITLCYFLIKLYDRNIRLLHFLWKPFEMCLKTFHKNQVPTTSIIDSFTTLIILSYTKFLYVSFPLVKLISVYKTNETSAEYTEEMYRYYFNPSVSILSSFNAIYFILGVFVLVFFVGFPPIFLILYPLHPTQFCIGKLPSRVHIALVTFADTFLGAFRDGTKRGRDCRSFAGFYFVFRILLFVIFVSSMEWLDQYLCQQILILVGLLVFAIVRPYKASFFNKLDASFFGLLGILNSLSFYNSQVNSQVIYNDKDKLQKSVFWINYILMYLPIVYFIALMVYLIWGLCVGSKHRYNSTKYDDEDGDGEVKGSLYYSNEDHDHDDLSSIDRVLNPSEYSLLDPVNTSSSSSGKNKEGCHGVRKKACTDGARVPDKSSYGSVTKRDCQTEPINLNA